jgi:hypothetical protein
MVQFIEKHRRLLQAYCLMARIIGWLLILGGVFWFFMLAKTLGNIMGTIGGQQQIAIVLYCAYSFTYDFVISGLLAFAIGGLLDYLLRPKAKPPLILGMMDKLCYVYAAFLILRFVGGVKSFSSDLWFVNFQILDVAALSESTRLVLMQPLLGPTLAKVLLLIGIGMILHRLLPVIEESKTLV